MPKGPTLKKVSHPRYEWRVRWREGTKDCQRYFVTGEKRVAESFMHKKAIELGNFGTKHGSISDDERAALISFRDAVGQMPEPRPTLRDCVNVFLSGIANQLAPVTVADLVAKRIAAAQKKGVHQRTLRDLAGIDGTRGRLGAFSAAFGDRRAAGVSAEEIEAWVGKQCATDSNQREMLIRLNGLFAYGVKRRYLRENPVARLEIPQPAVARAHILTVPEAHALLAHCGASIVPAVAVQLFAGLRHAETERLDWSDIDLSADTVKVIQRKGSGRRREKVRFAPLLPALKAWLKPHRQLSGPVFPVAVTGPREGKISAQAYRLGFARARKDAGLEAWDENTLRHTFGSYRTAALGDLEKVRLEMGHTTSRVTSEHYVNAVRAKDAAAFWKLMPPGKTPSNIIMPKKGFKSA